MAPASGTGVVWPPECIPLELFVMVAQYLPHEDQKALRLVNREFNSKIIGYFYRQLVIHLGPELNATLDAGLRPHGRSTAINTTDRVWDTQVFQDLGLGIRRLGFALDLSEQELASPNVPDLEDFQVASWGIYRWPCPIDDDPSNSLLQKITRSLEGLQGIFRILSTVKNVQELALSCEGGLGYLQGPDINPHQPQGPPAVFGNADTVRGTPLSSPQIYFQTPYRLEKLHRKLAAAGIDPEKFPAMIDTLLQNEHITMAEFLNDNRKRPPLPAIRQRDGVARPLPIHNGIRLQPDALTEAQARFLYQHMSAQQALIQSFLISLMDNSSCMTNLTKVNISRLPSCHMDLLCREDFWSKLPQLQEVALGVIPDWRSLSQNGNDITNVRQVYPTDAMPKVFKLLNEHIGTHPRIKRLHFEWICGGELAPGCMQRGRYVLPAPFLKDHRKVINSSLTNLLILPYITHLSLKNCWFTPHVFYKIIRTMAKKCLESLELETVSLTGPPRDPNDAPQGTNHLQGANLPSELVHLLHQRARVPDNPLQTAGELSWHHIIDMLMPGSTVQQHLHDKGRAPGEPNLNIRKELKLRKLVFKSCGYATVPDRRFIRNYVQPDLWPNPRPNLLFSSAEPDGTFEEPINDIDRRKGFMRKYLQVSTDRHLATVNQTLTAPEMTTLQESFGFRLGWDGVYDEALIRAARYDGYPEGPGRFTGTIEHDLPTPAMEDDESGKEFVSHTYDDKKFERDYNDVHRLDDVLSRLESREGYRTIPRPRQ
ncbi:hypothetical protein F4818DRAFT_454332 [Hypoxylon cercidicola]|nr:hypothetical protein F4818DRAFT_454332 [Hypoxylon cercidicola]